MADKPTVGQWLRYAFGFRLPPKLKEWVRHDLTDAGWRFREVVRVLVQAIIPVIVLISLPGPIAIRLFAAAILVLGALFVAAAYGDDLRDRRLRQHDLEPSQHHE